MFTMKRAALVFAFIWPWLVFILTAAYVIANIAVAVSLDRSSGLGWYIPGRYVVGLYLVTTLDIAVLLVLSIMDLFRSSAISDNIKPLWAVLLLLAGPFVLPVYGYLYILRSRN